MVQTLEIIIPIYRKIVLVCTTNFYYTKRFHVFSPFSYLVRGYRPAPASNRFKYFSLDVTPMQHARGILSSTEFNPGGMQLDARDTALMSLGTAAGGLQTLVLKRVFNELPPTSTTDIITSKSGIAAILVGLSFIGIGVAARTDMITFDKTIATLMLGYGISALISLGLNVITWNAAVATATPRSSRSMA
jgi:hypothetical protein